MPESVRDDLIELSDYAYGRLRIRMAGLTDEEYFWEPVPGCRTVRRQPDGAFRSDGPAGRDDLHQFTTLAWRLSHIAVLLTEERNGVWLGRPAPGSGPAGDPGTADDALTALDTAHENWRGVLAGTTDESLAAPIGSVAAFYAEATRRSFVLHVLDELIHHGAEAALLRDLFAARTTRLI